jgi:hypothetical protein
MVVAQTVVAQGLAQMVVAQVVVVVPPSPADPAALQTQRHPAV